MKQSQFPLFLSWFIASPSKYFWQGDRQWRKSGIMFARVSFCQCYSYSLILNIFLMLCSLVSLSQCGSPLVPQQCLCHGAPPPHPTPPHHWECLQSSATSFFFPKCCIWVPLWLTGILVWWLGADMWWFSPLGWLMASSFCPTVQGLVGACCLAA